MARVGSLFGVIIWGAVAVVLPLACGGSAQDGRNSDAGLAGSGASGGLPSGGAPSGAGVSGAAVSGAAGAAGGSCIYEGVTYAVGQSFPLRNDCNTCSCQADGSLVCSQRACPDKCAGVQEKYAEALERAKACDPTQQDQCTSKISDDARCGCPTPVNPANTDALTELSVQRGFALSACMPECTPCIGYDNPTCTAAGRCEDTPRPLEGIACKVGGVVYPNGTSRIPSPQDDCNGCDCIDGELGCTQRACPNNYFCAPGLAFGTQCAECGPTDACKVIEFRCLPTCSPACMNGACVDGLCRQVCI